MFMMTATRAMSLATTGPYKPFFAPLPNMVQFQLMESIFDKVTVECIPAGRMPGKIPLSLGDAGALIYGGGAISGRCMGASQATRASTKVFLGGKPAFRQTDSSTHNNFNAMGNTMMPSQTKVQVFS